jgi:hypothetical protein
MQLVEDRLKWATDTASNCALANHHRRHYWKQFGFDEIDRSTAPIGISNSHQWSAGYPASATAMRKII